MNLSENAQTAVQKYLAKFGIDLLAKKKEEPLVKLEDVTLIDGTILSVDKMEVGAAATFTGADGVAVPAEGEFELADGTTVICAAGLITEIKPKEADVQPEAESEMKAMLSKLSERLDSIEKNSIAKATTLEAQLSETKGGLLVALQAIDKIENTSVAVNLESQTKSKVAISLESMTELDKHRARRKNQLS